MLKFPKISSANLLYLSIFSFVFIASSAITLANFRSKEVVAVKAPIVLEDKQFPALPILVGNNTLPELSASSVLAQDLDSGVILFEKNADVKLFPASTTKMITALTASDYYKLEDVLRVSGIAVTGQKMGLLEAEEISVHDLLTGLLIYSANDAAEVLAANYCEIVDIKICGRDIFIAAMNMKARELHLNNSNFVNPTGLDSLGHYSTSRDLVRIAREVMNNHYLRKTVSTKEETVSSSDGKFKHKLVNLNELVGEVDGVLGVKTGWTEYAKENLVTYVDRDGKKIIIAVLGSDDRFGETKTLINWIYDNYEWKQINISS